MALHVRQQTSHVVYRFPPCRDRAESRRYLGAFERLSAVKHPHILAVEQFSFGAAARGWLVTPYPGNQDGLLTLRRLTDLKGGQLGVFEAERAMVHLLEAVGHAQESGLLHGPMRAEEVLVDRYGSLLVECYGLRLAVSGLEPGPDIRRDEIRAVAGIGYSLLTGLEAGESLIVPSRVLKRLERAWDEWFATALDAGGGFATAREAIEALPGRRKEALEPSPSKVRVVMNRFKGVAGKR